MAFTSGRSSRFILDTADFSTSLREAACELNCTLLETSNFGQAGAKTYLVGLIDGRMTMGGYYQPGAGNSDVIVNGLIGAANDSLFAFAPQGLWAPGTRVFQSSGRSATYNLSSPVQDMVTFGAEIAPDLSRGVESAISLHDPAVLVSATENLTGNDETTNFFGATTTAGGAAHLNVTVNSRSTNTVITLEHSTNNSTWVTLLTFATVANAALTKERQTVAAGTTINRYVRATATPVAGTGTIQYMMSWSRYAF